MTSFDMLIAILVAIGSVYYTSRRMMKHRHELKMAEIEVRKLQLQHENAVWGIVQNEKKELEND